MQQLAYKNKQIMYIISYNMTLKQVYNDLPVFVTQSLRKHNCSYKFMLQWYPA